MLPWRCWALPCFLPPMDSAGPAGLAWIVCLLHLAAHSLAKGTLFLTADGVYSVNDSYLIRQTGLLRNILYSLAWARSLPR